MLSDIESFQEVMGEGRGIKHVKCKMQNLKEVLFDGSRLLPASSHLGERCAAYTGYDEK